MHNIIETSVRSSLADEKDRRGKEDTRIGTQTDPPLACFYLRNEKKQMKSETSSEDR